MKNNINTLVLKIASRCNLNCTYCYMYNVGDNTYLNQPKFMSNKIIDEIFDKVYKNCKKNDIKSFHFTLHGGEPLLAPKEMYYYFVEKAENILKKNGIEYEFVLQTNAVLLTKEWCELFNDLNIIVGASLDGLKRFNDVARIDHKGKGSYERIIKGLKIGNKYLTSSMGILSVINIEAPALETYKHFCDLGTKHMDFLLPDATHDVLPPVPKNNTSKTPYGDWLIEIFDYWFSQTKEERIEMRLFETLMHSILGGEFNSDGFGNLDNDVLLIETNGDIEVVGSLKMCGNGFTKRGANVFKNDFEDAFDSQLTEVYQKASSYLPEKCTSCSLKDVCGGGHLVQRFSKEKGFNNVSVYCKDYMKLITHIQNKIIDNIPEKYIHLIEFDRVTFDEILEEAFLYQPSDNPKIDYINKLESFKVC